MSPHRSETRDARPGPDAATIGAADIGTADIEAADMGATDIGATDIEAADIEAAGAGPGARRQAPSEQREGPMANLRYDDHEEALRESVRALLTAHCPADRVLGRIDGGDEPYDMALWARLADQVGAAALAVPEEHGGASASFREVAVVLEELGRAVAPVPFLGSAVVATRTLLACDAADPIERLAAGEVVTLAVPFTTAPDTRCDPVAVAGGPVLSGTVTSVADALPADLLLVVAPDGLYAVETRRPEVRMTPVVSLDATRTLADIVLTDAPARLITPGAVAARAVADGLTAGAALLASEQVGVAQWCLDAAVDYARLRHQFDRPIGSFQALKHQLADLWVAVTESRAVARYAADCLATGDADTPVAASLAQAYCAEVAVTAAETCLQLHGGTGFTWEHPVHLYLKRARAGMAAFGTADRHRAILARLVDLPPPVPHVQGIDEVFHKSTLPV